MGDKDILSRLFPLCMHHLGGRSTQTVQVTWEKSFR